MQTGNVDSGYRAENAFRFRAEMNLLQIAENEINFSGIGQNASIDLFEAGAVKKYSPILQRRLQSIFPTVNPVKMNALSDNPQKKQVFERQQNANAPVVFAFFIDYRD
nr:hypothetical protein [Cohnella massiliensis]